MPFDPRSLVGTRVRLADSDNEQGDGVITVSAPRVATDVAAGGVTTYAEVPDAALVTVLFDAGPYVGGERAFAVDVVDGQIDSDQIAAV